MPYIKGRRVTNEEWTRTYGTIERLRTGPDGENPGEPPELDESGAPQPKPEKAPKAGKAGGNRSAKSAKATKAAIADALGVSPDSSKLADIDLSGLDAPTKQEDPE